MSKRSRFTQDNERPTVLLLSFSPLHKDPRVLRQAVFLKDQYDVAAAGFGPPSPVYPEHIVVQGHPNALAFKAMQASRLKLGRFEAYYWSQTPVKDAYRKLHGRIFHAIVANDLSSLPLAVTLAAESNARLILDVHEYEPGHFDGHWLFDFFFKPLWEYIARKYLPAVDSMSTVCEGIAALYQKNFSVQPTVITNAPFRSPLPPSEVQSKQIRIVHHGICNAHRELGAMVSMARMLSPRFQLDLMLVKTDEGSYAKIRRQARMAENISLLAPVPYEDIVPTLNSYDMGLCMFPPSTPTLQFALPNKFFEFLQAGLAVCSWPSPEIRNIIERHQCGIVAEAYTAAAMAQAVESLSAHDIAAMKHRSRQASAEHCAENNQAAFLRMVRGEP